MRRTGFYLLLIAIWEAIYRLSIWPPYLLPGPLEVASSLASGLLDGTLLVAVAASFRRLAIGYGLALAAGVSLGLLLARNRTADELLGPLVSGLQAIPSIAWLPLTVLWLGLSEASIITIVFLGAVWSIVVNTQAGIRNVPPLWIRAAMTMGASGSRLFSSVVLPAALPQMLSGWRLAWAFSWRALMAGELLSPGKGLGEVLIVSRNVNDMPAVLAVIVIIGVFGSLVDNLLFQRVEEQTRRKWGLAAA